MYTSVIIAPKSLLSLYKYVSVGALLKIKQLSYPILQGGTRGTGGEKGTRETGGKGQREEQVGKEIGGTRRTSGTKGNNGNKGGQG